MEYYLDSSSLFTTGLTCSKKTRFLPEDPKFPVHFCTRGFINFLKKINRNTAKFMVFNDYLDLLQREKFNISFILFAIAYDRYGIFEYFCESMIGHYKKKFRTIVHYVIDAGNVKMLKFLIDHGINVSEENTVIHVIKKGYLPCLELLIQENVKIMVDACDIAIEYDKGECLEYLLDKGFQVDLRTYETAIRKDRDDYLKILLERNTWTEGCDNFLKHGIYVCAINYSSVKCLKLLLEKIPYHNRALLEQSAFCSPECFDMLAEEYFPEDDK